MIRHVMCSVCIASGVAVLAATPLTSRQAHFPTVLRGARLHGAATPGAVPAGTDWSDVLSAVPLPPGARLLFFEVRQDAAPPVAVAEYRAAGTAAAALSKWYRDRLAALGWHLALVTAVEQVWHRTGQMFRIELPSDASDGTFRITRDAEAVLPAGSLSLVGGLPLPAGARRQRYDAADMFAEEVRVTDDPAGAEEAARSSLAASGWQQTGASQLADTRILRFVRSQDRAVVAVRALDGGGSEIGLGIADCLDRVTPHTASGSIYLDRVPAPADSSVRWYQRQDAGAAHEGWLAGCHDVDLIAGLAAQQWSVLGWSVPATGIQRSHGRAWLVGAPPTGGRVEMSIQGGDSSVQTTLSATLDLCRPTAWTSLLFADIPLPDGSQAQSLVVDPAGEWPWWEVYRLDREAGVGGWFRTAAMSVGWFAGDALPGPGDEASVYYRDGEEVLVTMSHAGSASMSVGRRRACATGAVVPVPDEGGRSRHLSEVPVFPGAAFESYEDGAEHYVARCTSFDQLADWYRRALERGAWAMAMVVGPSDPVTRTLTFVRPEERAWPPDQRTAWAEITLVREWPYTYRLLHRRDASGVVPGTATP